MHTLAHPLPCIPHQDVQDVNNLLSADFFHGLSSSGLQGITSSGGSPVRGLQRWSSDGLQWSCGEGDAGCPPPGTWEESSGRVTVSSHAPSEKTEQKPHAHAPINHRHCDTDEVHMSTMGESPGRGQCDKCCIVRLTMIFSQLEQRGWCNQTPSAEGCDHDVSKWKSK